MGGHTTCVSPSPPPFPCSSTSPPFAVQSLFVALNDDPPARLNFSLPIQHGLTANAAAAARHLAIVKSVALPQACRATPTSKPKVVFSIMSTTTSTLVSPAAAARRSRISALLRFISTAVKRTSGKRLARGRMRLPEPAPKSTTRMGGIASASSRAARSRSSSRSTTAKDSTCHRLRMARKLTTGCAAAAAVVLAPLLASSPRIVASFPSFAMLAGSQDGPMDDHSIGFPSRQAGVSSSEVKDAREGGAIFDRISFTAACLRSVLRRLWRCLCSLCLSRASSRAASLASSSPSASSLRRLLEPCPIAPTSVSSSLKKFWLTDDNYIIFSHLKAYRAA